MIKPEIIKTGTVYSDSESLFGYAAWPSVAIAENGDMLVVCSGMRTAHIDPFGKVILMRSDDMGETFFSPQVIVDTPLDDRDAGILILKDKILLTTFNNRRADQRKWVLDKPCDNESDRARRMLIEGQLGRISDKAEEKYCASSVFVGDKKAKSFGMRTPIPVSSPHGPAVSPSGRVLYMGRRFGYELDNTPGTSSIDVYEISDDMSYKKIGEVPYCGDPEVYYCEPHMLFLTETHIIAHIRIQGGARFTVYQSESFDGGYTWSDARDLGVKGAPPHLIRLDDGRIICTYGRRTRPYGISAMVSADEGKTWETEIPLVSGLPSSDLGYPASVVLGDGSIYTVYYGKMNENDRCGIFSIKWRI